MYFKVLPEIAASIAAPMASIDKITMYGEGNTSKLVGDITKSMTQVTEGLTKSLGFDMQSMITGALGGHARKNPENEPVDYSEINPAVQGV